MNDDELHRPLGQNARKAAEKAKASNLRRTWMILGGVLGVVGAGALALAARDPLGWSLWRVVPMPWRGSSPISRRRRSRRDKRKAPRAAQQPAETEAPPRGRAAAIMFSH